MNLNFSPSFIETYDKVLSSDECNILITQFEKNPNKAEGKVHKDEDYGIDKDFKNSLELVNPRFSEPTVITSIISSSLNKCMDRYMKKYSMLNNYMGRYKADDVYTFKKFEGNDGGYKCWHYEHGIGEASNRVFVWSFYLNDSPGTDFMFYPNVSGKEGRCVIFPASFNYMHRSAPNKGIKYYVSGWISYV